MATRRAHAAATLALLVAALVLSAAPAEGAVTCGQVVGYIAPCITYAMGRTRVPDGTCCTGVRSLNSAAATTADRQATCSCLKQRTGSMGGLKPDLIAGIPGKCGVNIPYAISPSTDCNKVR